MTASARTLSIEETLLEPPALPPPPTRHALLRNSDCARSAVTCGDHWDRRSLQ